MVRSPALREKRKGDDEMGWSVGQLLKAILATNTLAVLLVGGVGAFAVHETTQTVDRLSQEISPAQQSNARFMEAMLDSETEMRAFLISGERTQLGDYRRAVALAPEVERDLHSYSAVHPQLAALVSEQDEAAAEWVDDFSTRAARGGGGPGTYQPALYELGVLRFDAIKDVNRRITAELGTQVEQARAAAQHRLNSTVTLIAVIALLAALVSAGSGWFALRSIRRPLSRLESTVDRLAAGHLDARAPANGPAEIRRVATALNDLAEENGRARALELHVQQELVEVDRAKSEFVSNVSHELRTPLTSISGYLELLTEGMAGKVSAEEAGMLEVTNRNVGRLRDLIEHLLELGSVERSPDQLEPVDIGAVMRGVATDLRFSAGSRHITIRVEYPREAAPVVVLAEGAQLHRAILNLASNAVKFSQEGGVVRLRLEAIGQEVLIRVTDEGIGIPAADQAKLGERFYRASNAVSAHIPGTGLGLRMVQSIVSNHQGTFELSSVEGEGTTATVRLPVSRDAHDDAAREQTIQALR